MGDKSMDRMKPVIQAIVRWIGESGMDEVEALKVWFLGVEEWEAEQEEADRVDGFSK